MCRWPWSARCRTAHDAPAPLSESTVSDGRWLGRKCALCRGFRLRPGEHVYDPGVLDELGTAIEGLDIPVEGDALAAVMALRDRLDARISDAVAALDTSGLWELEGATSMTAWLADRGGMARSRAAATAARARKLAPLSLSPGLWRDGGVSGGPGRALAAPLPAA